MNININLTKKNSPHSFSSLLLISLLSTIVSGCGSSSSENDNLIIDPNLEPDKTLEDGTKLVGLPKNKTKSLFTSTTADSSEQYIRNYLIKTYNEVPEYYYSDSRLDTAVTEEADNAEANDKTATSTTNTIEESVDEADLIKTFSQSGKDYLVTITQPERTYFYARNVEAVESYKQQNTAAKLNLFNIDTIPSSTLLTSVSLNEDAYNVSGIYSYQSAASANSSSTQIVAQTSLWQAPTDWNDYNVWGYGRTGIESTQLTNQEFGDKWSIVFDGHLLDSRRINNNMYVALRHYSRINTLEYPYGNDAENAAIIAKNKQIIEQLDLKALLPTVSIKYTDSNNTSPVFDLESCHLPNNEERFANGSIMFNYVAQIDLDTGSIITVQCILSEINQLYMNEKSLFLIDANNWTDQTSRLHKFNLAI
ncbi:beta-propeller domain-containing protein [Colwellia sp. E2M01]|uniref:beta-propeller domain-containing protein n=1 Tax=Colwellia sp. E2M01 TaxID=2841561 RepID=UPI001C088F8E|nr:beta-propeller domain-containing protein [Colwellia sp. E2M01]MBU2871665.1 beta-propeller domain-containing protein [Colwellia sp. E2M01]